MSSLSSHGRWEVVAGVEVEGFCVVHFVLFCCTQNAHLSVLWEFFECKTSKWLAHLNSISEKVIWLNMPSCCWICCRYNDDRTWTNFICRFFALISCFYFFVAVFQFSVFPRCRRFHSLDFWFFFHTCASTLLSIFQFLSMFRVWFFLGCYWCVAVVGMYFFVIN